MTTTETWAPVHIEEFREKYEVSDQGRVRNKTTGHVLSPMRTGTKRPGSQRSKVRFRTNPRADFDVAALVLEAFVAKRPEGAICMHANDDSSDNRAANLRWGTPLENARDAARKGRSANQILTAEIAAEVAEMRRSGVSGVETAKKFGISQQRVCDIIKGRCVFTRAE